MLFMLLVRRYAKVKTMAAQEPVGYRHVTLTFSGIRLTGEDVASAVAPA
jgi:hypothetical protein